MRLLRLKVDRRGGREEEGVGKAFFLEKGKVRDTEGIASENAHGEKRTFKGEKKRVADDTNKEKGRNEGNLLVDLS